MSKLGAWWILVVGIVLLLASVVMGSDSLMAPCSCGGYSCGGFTPGGCQGSCACCGPVGGPRTCTCCNLQYDCDNPPAGQHCIFTS